MMVDCEMREEMMVDCEMRGEMMVDCEMVDGEMSYYFFYLS